VKRLTNLVKALALQSGAQAVGIASAEIMNKHALEGQKPEQNLPDAKAVISFGIRMLDSIFKTRNVSMILRHLRLEFSEAVHRSLLWPKTAD
jgi:hypothetical protein